MFLGKYFPPSMVTKLRNEITNFRQRPDESLFEAWERYKLSIDRCLNHNMRTFMKRRPEECYDLIKNMTAHHNDWDTSAQRSESSSSITSSFDTKIAALKAEMAEINKNLMRVLQVNQQVKAVTPNCETCGGPHSFNNCPATVGNTQNVYAAGAYQVTNPKEKLKGITTRSGTAYQGPTIPTTSSSLPPVVERETTATKDMVHPTNNGSTKDVNLCDLLLEEVDAFLALEDDPTSPEVDQSYVDTERNILLLKAFLNDDPSLPPPNPENYFPQVRKGLKICKAKTDKSSIDEPPEVELKDLPSTLEYTFLEGDDKFPIIIAKDLSVEEKAALITDDFEPAVQHQRRVNHKIHDVIKNEVLKLLVAGLIYLIFDSPWCVYIEYRMLNEATLKDHFPLPFMDQMLEKLARNEYYYFLDGFSGYFQIPIDPKDQEKTTFTCPDGTFAYRRIPFGLCNAPATFQRCMMVIFHDMVEKTMEVFMDDFSEKSHFMVKEGIVLCHKISKNGIKVDKAKVDVIAKLPHPTTVKGIHSFLGHAGVYRRFIKDFSKIARPMTRLLEKDTLFFFSKEYVEAFQTLKIKLTKALILIAPDWDLPFELMCDASNFAIGAVLGQRQENHFRSIHYASKTMTEAESNYTITEKEMLAVVYAFEKFRSYLIMNKSIVYTDHSALKYLFAKKDSKARLLRWVLLLREFTFKVIDTKGVKNLVEAKALSTNDARVVCKFLKTLFARFGTPRAIISDREMHFYNDQFEKVMLKYGVTHRLATAYHPQTSGQVEVANCGLKRILERTVGENRTSWSDKLDDAF
uniref:Reverse transcriptase domain-containing protein n=1 Tax=Tanacetum cinerariifolium TaxID=118510 RepID=A0A6L2JPN6_TANCI|nr:reverse transcriptase domain-containing protein [Tanacetum cinerariifolium]